MRNQVNVNALIFFSLHMSYKARKKSQENMNKSIMHCQAEVACFDGSGLAFAMVQKDRKHHVL